MNFVQELETIRILGAVIFYVYIFCICVQDMKTMKVVRVFHLLGACGIVCLYLGEGMSGIEYKSILIFIFFQLLFYALKCFGLADLFFLINCSFYIGILTTYYDVLLVLFLYELFANVSLILIQLSVGNLKKGKLQKKVAYIPYLSVAFILTNIVF